MFHSFTQVLVGGKPEKFTYPFCYTPHAWARQAVSEVVAELERRRVPLIPSGKMFGVLVVENDGAGEIGFLAAFSGSGMDDDGYFVPSIYTLPAGAIPKGREESKRLQEYIFSQYRMLNAKGEERDLLDIFATTPLRYPPSGSGDCCAPKLLQYAFRHALTPLCMAEFWWGESPRDEVRHHLHYYPACMGRCKPILGWMLQGLMVDENPLERVNADLEEQLRVLYDDEWLMVVDKPSGMLSVPGRSDVPCMADIVKKRMTISVLPVHRLDMFTSGLQILVKGADMQSSLQRLFEGRQVQKRYVALLDGVVEADSGEIRLPLSSDYLNRPRQRVDYEHGKTAVTRYEVVWRREGRTLVNLFPHTGRTHQLRVHCASREGLGCPIVGDALYGTPAERLCLQAQELTFRHPITNAPIHICLDTLPF